MNYTCLSLSQQIEYLTAQYTTAKNKVLSDLDSKLNSDCLHEIFVYCLSPCLHVSLCLSMNERGVVIEQHIVFPILPDRHWTFVGWEDSQEAGDTSSPLTGHGAAYGRRYYQLVAEE